MSGTQESTVEIECPHCHRCFESEPLPVGRAARYHGFKCPHCNLFVPAARVDGPSRSAGTATPSS